jgi:hypothetical protein
VSKNEKYLRKQIWTTRCREATAKKSKLSAAILLLQGQDALCAMHPACHHRTYSAAIIASSPGLFLIRRVGPFVEISSLALNSVRARVTVSRVTPTT